MLQLHIFLSVIENKSFTKSAEALNLTQSAVSQAIAGLESELGVTLLNRGRSGVTLTETGERILVHAREILNRTALIKQEVASSLGLEIGSLRVGSIPSVSAKLLPGIIASFKMKYPGIQMTLFEGSYEEVKEWIQSSVIDIGFISLPEEHADTIPLVQDKMVLFMPADHRYSGEKHLDLHQISNDSFIMPKADCEDFIKEIFARQGIVPNVKFEVRDTATILAMVQEGVGVTMLPEMAIPTSVPNVSSCYLRPLAYRNVGLGVRSLATATPATSAFIKQSQEYVRDLSFKLYNSYQSVLKYEM